MKTLLRVVLVAALVLPAALRAENSDAAAASRANLKAIHGALKAYALLYEGKRPQRLGELLDEGLLDSAEVFVVPGSGHTTPPRGEVDAKGDYTLEPLATAPDLKVREKMPTHTPGKVLAVLKDGTLALLDAPAGTLPSPAGAAPVAATTTAGPAPGAAIATAPTPLPPVTPPGSTPGVATSPPAPEPGPSPEPQREAALSSPPPAVESSVSAPPPVPAEPGPTVIGPGTVSAVPANPFGAPAGDALTRANAAFAEGKVADAKAMFSLLVAQNPRSVEALVGLGRTHNASGEIDAALARYREVQRIAPNTPNLRAWMAELLLAQRRFDAARALLREELQSTRSAWAVSWLGTVEAEAGNTRGATGYFQQAVAMDGRVVEQRYQNALALENSGQPQRALSDLRSVASMQPGFAGSYFAMGSCYAKLGRRDLAVQSYQRFLAAGGINPWADHARAEIARLR